MYGGANIIVSLQPRKQAETEYVQAAIKSDVSGSELLISAHPASISSRESQVTDKAC
jgi:hypothetical protein